LAGELLFDKISNVKEEWQNYWRETRYYLRFFPLGLLTSLIPFFLAFGYWREQNALLFGFIYSLTFGVIVSLVSLSTFALIFAGLLVVRLRTGIRLELGVFSEIAIALFGMLAGIWLALFVREQIWGEKFAIPTLLSALVLGTFIGILFFLYIYYSRARADALALKAAAAESRYQTLEHQMRPHFLFNALNSLAELIESKHESAADMTYLLADLYRQILANSKLKTAPLTSEIEIARRYLDLEKLRFGERLSYSINVKEPIDNLYLPSLMLQTLVENAVKHGVAKSVNGGAIDIEIHPVAKSLYQLTVSNTGTPFQAAKQNGTGLDNTRARLELLYPNRHQFAITADGERTIARFNFTGEQID
jgi:hypothetical protein